MMTNHFHSIPLFENQYFDPSSLINVICHHSMKPGWEVPHSHPHKKRLRYRVFYLSSLCTSQASPRNDCIKNHSAETFFIITDLCCNLSESAPGRTTFKRQPRSFKSLLDFLCFEVFFWYLYVSCTIFFIDYQNWKVIIWSPCVSPVREVL